MTHPAFFKNSFIAWAIFAVGIAATLFASREIKRDIEQDAVRRFAATCDQVALKMTDRLEAYALILRGGAGLFAGANSVDRHKWHRYVETLRAQGSVPGVQGIGFAQLIAPEQLAAHVAAVRDEGFADYNVRPPGARPVYTSIIYLEPFSGRNLRAFGYDMFSEPVRRAAMEQARDSGEAALSDKVVLVQETEAQAQAGTLMYFPVYRKGAATGTVAQRRAALIGWTYSPYRMNDLMQGMLADWTSNEGKLVDLHVYDGDTAQQERTLFDSRPEHAPNMQSLFYQQRKVVFNGQRWLLAFDGIGATESIDYTPSWAALAGGVTLSGLLCGLLLSLMRTRERAELIAKKLTEEIGELNRDFVSFLENTSDFIYFKDIDSRFRFCSQTLANITGHASWRDLIGKHDLEVFPPETARIYYEEEIPVFREGKPLLNKVDPYFDAAGKRGWVSTNKWPLFDCEGKVAGLFGISRDITALVEAQDAMRESESRFRQMFEHNDSVMLLIDAGSGKLVDANAAAARFYGYSVEQLKQMRIIQINTLPPEEVAAEMAQAVRHERNYFVFPHRLANGEIRTVEVRSSPITVEGQPPLLISIIHDITARKLAEEQVRQLAFHDALTQLPNRRLLIDRLAQAMAASKRSGCYCALIFLDLDNFKPLNDAHGHEVGDLLLIEVARRLKTCVRESDTVARFGGDEFVVMLSELKADRDESTMEAAGVAEKIRALLSEPYRLSINREGKADAVVLHRCSASIGVALFINHEAAQDDILKWADMAMYQAKEDGGNVVRFYASNTGAAPALPS